MLFGLIFKFSKVISENSISLSAVYTLCGYFNHDVFFPFGKQHTCEIPGLGGARLPAVIYSVSPESSLPAASSCVMPYSHLHCRHFRFCVTFRWKFCVIFISYFYLLFSSSVCYSEVSGSLLATLFIISVLWCQRLFNLLTFIGSRTLENTSVFSKQLSPMPSIKTSPTLIWFIALSAIYLLPLRQHVHILKDLMKHIIHFYNAVNVHLCLSRYPLGYRMGIWCL